MRFVIFGAGGHSREVADLVIAAGHEIAGFQDDQFTGEHRPTGLVVTDGWRELEAEAGTIAIGDTAARDAFYQRLAGQIALPVLVHPSACVSVYARVGDGTQVMQNVVVNSAALVGVNVILNVGCLVAHDCAVGDHCHIAPGAIMSGGSSVGERCLLGSAAVLLPGVSVGADCVVGAGAVVTRDVPDGSVVRGVPGRAESRGDR
ncbi:MAG TPA: acetyltransferase [Actinobacteria bacterium]|nr:acetyltransferase [Actinomycetota bacterium]